MERCRRASLRFSGRPARAWAGAAIVVAVASGPRVLAGQSPGETRCAGARASLAEELAITAVIEPDTLDDWRTRRTLPGCRVTGAGLTTRSDGEAARQLFERLRGVGWVRTPEPMDFPAEASLRLRRDGVDCLFSFASGGLLDTDAALRVDRLVVPGPGERRYNVVARCVPALPAAPRDAG